MARPIKKGLAYFPVDVDIFSDRKVKILMARFGSNGLSYYIYLLCRIYSEGYYITADEDFDVIAAAELGMTEELIKTVRTFMLERSMFDDTLFKSDNVLTSKGIQRRYQQAVKQRAVKRPVRVDKRFWLLDSDETEPYISTRPEDDNSGNNESKSGNNRDKSGNNPLKEKKSKEKKSKVNKSIAGAPNARPLGRYKNVKMSDKELEALKDEYPREYSEWIEKLSEYMEITGKSYRNHLAVIRSWAEKEKKRRQQSAESHYGRKSSLPDDIDELSSLALFSDC